MKNIRRFDTLVRTLTAFASGLTLCVTAHAAEHPDGWSYGGDSGPEIWGSLMSQFELCETGRMQSPVDLDQENAVGDLEFSVDWDSSPLVVSNSGKTVQANFQPGSYMTSGGRVFNLLQVHFHTPSEHTFSGQTYPMVAHFVHSTNEGRLGVLGILFEEGEENTELQKILDAVGDADGSARPVKGVSLDPNGMLPRELEIFRYVGSLTTPPCSEGVQWHVAEDAVQASSAQIGRMESVMGMNARPVQPLNGRLLVEPD